jgi:hypothetical protein
MTPVKRFFLVTICVSCFIFNTTTAQTSKSDCQGFRDSLLHKFVYKGADQMPAPVGGINLFFRQLTKQLRLSAVQQQIMTHFVVGFVIEKDGTINGTRIIKGYSTDTRDLGKQILAVIKQTRWQPALCNGKPVAFLYVLPFNIELEE